MTHGYSLIAQWPGYPPQDFQCGVIGRRLSSRILVANLRPAHAPLKNQLSKLATEVGKAAQRVIEVIVPNSTGPIRTLTPHREWKD